MNDYMQALHQRFFREPECADVREEIEELRQELRETLQKPERRKLLRLVDVQNLLREETSLASFMAGFKLAWGLAQELEADGLYSFEDEEDVFGEWVFLEVEREFFQSEGVWFLGLLLVLLVQQ